MPEVDLLSIDRGSVTAPAGCGKTELITDALKRYTGSKPILILTHTNAGVAALRARLNRAGVGSKRYHLATIDGWVLKLIKMFPKVSGHNAAITKVLNPSRDYPAVRQAGQTVLQKRHLWRILQASYDRVIVDEYQDCNDVQHMVVCALAQELETCVLGDPMQAIFNFRGNTLVDWERDVRAFFPSKGELSVPWRWNNSGVDDLGQWLLYARQELYSGRQIDLRQAPKPHVVWHPLGNNDDEVRRQAARTRPPVQGAKVLVIGESANLRGHHDCARQTPGAVVVEAVSLTNLIQFANTFDPSSEDALSRLVTFAQNTMTGIASAELFKRLDTISKGKEKKPPSPSEHFALIFQNSPTYLSAAEFLEACQSMIGSRVYRPTLLFSGIEALQRAHQNQMPLTDAAINVREEYRAKGRSIPFRAVGSTLLLKGLEAEVSVILNGDELSKQNLYVALTRGSMRVEVCSNSPVLG